MSAWRAGCFAGATCSRFACTPMTSVRSSAVAAGPPGRCGPWSAPLPGTGTSASTSWRPARLGKSSYLPGGRPPVPPDVRPDGPDGKTRHFIGPVRTDGAAGCSDRKEQLTLQVTVGRIGRPHGLRGAVVVGVRTDEPEL